MPKTRNYRIRNSGVLKELPTDAILFLAQSNDRCQHGKQERIIVYILQAYLVGILRNMWQDQHQLHTPRTVRTAVGRQDSLVVGMKKSQLHRSTYKDQQVLCRHRKLRCLR